MSRLCCFVLGFVGHAWFIDFNESGGKEEKMPKKAKLIPPRKAGIDFWDKFVHYS